MRHVVSRQAWRILTPYEWHDTAHMLDSVADDGIRGIGDGR
jgi:hypothetical protein